ncbi:hypothetical protein AKJ16_DCAP03681 [Drosera capensis]
MLLRTIQRTLVSTSGMCCIHLFGRFMLGLIVHDIACDFCYDCGTVTEWCRPEFIHSVFVQRFALPISRTAELPKSSVLPHSASFAKYFRMEFCFF